MSSKIYRNHDPRSPGQYGYEDADRGRGRRARSDSREQKGSSPYARKHGRDLDVERERSRERRKRDDMRPLPPTATRRRSRGRSRSVESRRSAKHDERSPHRPKRHRYSPSPRRGSHRHKKRHASISPADKRRRSRSPGHNFSKHKRPKRPRTRSRSPPPSVRHGTRDVSRSPLPASGSPPRKHKSSGRHRDRSASPPRRHVASPALPPAAYRKRSPPHSRREPGSPLLPPPPAELSPLPPPSRSRGYSPERGSRRPPSPPPLKSRYASSPAHRGSSPRRELSKKNDADYLPSRHRHSQARSDRSPYRDRPDQPPPPSSSSTRARSPLAYPAYSPPPMRTRSPLRSARQPRELFPERRPSPPATSSRSHRTALERGPPERRPRGRREDDHGPPEGRTRSRSRESNRGPPRRRTPPRSPKRDAAERPTSRRSDAHDAQASTGDPGSKGQSEATNGPYVNPERQRLVHDRPERGSGRGRGRGRGRGGRGGADHHRNQPLTFGGEFPPRGRGSIRGGRGGTHSEAPDQQDQSPPPPTQERSQSDSQGSQRSQAGFVGVGSRSHLGQRMSPEANGERSVPTGPAADQKPSEIQPPTKPAPGEEPAKSFKKVVSGPDNAAPDNAPTAPAAEKIKFTMAIPTKPSKPVKPAPKALDMRMGKFATGSNSAPLGGRTIDLTARLSRARQPEPRPTSSDGSRRSRRRSPPRHARAPSPPPPPPPPPPGPEIIVKDMAIYHRVSMVGEGTYGKVYKASNNLTKELVALKRIRMENEKDGFPITAVREMKLLQALKHENIVSLLEMMVEKSDFYMVFEYMDHDLTGILNHPTFRLGPPHIKHLAKQFFDALHYLHHRGVLHRDIKGSNILLNNDGQLKIADFGLARFYSKNSKKEMDYTNRIITLWYRPPEILLGATAYGPAVDMWSAACVFVELFTRVPIFPGRTEIDQLDIIYTILGKPTEKVWPKLKQMPWYSLLRTSGLNRKNRFRKKFAELVPSSAMDLIAELLQYDPERRPTAEDCLKHAYFSEDPAPEPPLGLRDLRGDWHEYESKMERRKERDNQKKRHDADRRKAKEAKEAAKRSEQAQEKTEHGSARPSFDGSNGSIVPVKRKIERAASGGSDDMTGSDLKRTRSEGQM